MQRFFSKPPSKDKFANMVLAGIQRAGEKKKIVYDKENFCLRGEDGQITNLVNAYPEYCSVDKSLRPQLLQKWVRLWFMHLQEIPSEFDDARSDILPALKSRSFYELNRLRIRVESGKEVDWAYQPCQRALKTSHR